MAEFRLSGVGYTDEEMRVLNRMCKSMLADINEFKRKKEERKKKARKEKERKEKERKEKERKEKERKEKERKEKEGKESNVKIH